MLTTGLVWATAAVNGNNYRQLLQVEVRQAASVVGVALDSVQSELADLAQIESLTNSERAFDRFAATKLPPRGSFSSLVLFKRTPTGPRLVATVGAPPALLTKSDWPELIERVPRGDQLDVMGFLGAKPARLGFAELPSDDTKYIIYAESLVPGQNRVNVPSSAAFNNLQFAVYLGHKELPTALVEASVATPLQGTTASEQAPFGNTVITIVGESTVPLTGSLTAALPWLVGGTGAVVTIAGASVLEYILRRRRFAERLALENERLYLEQRTIARALQDALLPRVPVIEGLRIAVRYIPGVSRMDVGGDWYDVLGREECCTFIVGDVSGRGLTAATAMASLRFATRAYLAQGDQPAAVLEKLPRAVDFESIDQFATVLIGEIDLQSPTLRLVSAGHYPPLLIAGEQAAFAELEIAPPVGVTSDGLPPTTELALPATGTLLAFTDGLVERRGEFLGTSLNRLRDAAISLSGRPLEAMVDELVAALLPDNAQDDLAVLALQWG